MITFKAYKFKLYSNEEQMKIINQTFGSTKFVYNFFLSRKDEYYKETKTHLTLSMIKHELISLKENNSWLKDVDSMALTTTLENLDRAYINYFKKKMSHPVYKKKGCHESYKSVNIKSNYKGENYNNIFLDVKSKEIKLPKLGIVKVRGYRHLSKELNIINATISKEGNKYYVSLCVKDEIEVVKKNIRNAVGIDIGVESLVTTSDGIKYHKLLIKRVENHIEVLQQRLSRCVKGSKNYYQIKNKIARLYQKIKNMRKYYIHEVTNEIIKDNDLIVCESLKTKEMIEISEYKSLTKGIVNACFSEIIAKLEYKTKWYGKTLIHVNTYYPSSKICHHCGTRNEINNLSIREFECIKCHIENDRDINASINILDEGIRLAIKEKIIKI